MIVLRVLTRLSRSQESFKGGRTHAGGLRGSARPEVQLLGAQYVCSVLEALWSLWLGRGTSSLTLTFGVLLGLNIGLRRLFRMDLVWRT